MKSYTIEYSYGPACKVRASGFNWYDNKRIVFFVEEDGVWRAIAVFYDVTSVVEDGYSEKEPKIEVEWNDDDDQQ